jgi:hypothetical protein
MNVCLLGHGQYGLHCGTFDIHVSSPDGASLIVGRDKFVFSYTDMKYF